MRNNSTIRPKQRRARKTEVSSPTLANATSASGRAGLLRPEAGPLPDEIADGAFSRLDRNVPLLLLPLRIETRYHFEADPPELRIRIYPEQIHIDADRPAPSEVEQELTKEFWARWYSAKGEAGRKAAWQRFVKKIGSKRAGYLARMFRPTQGPDGTLTFPTPIAPSTRPAPARPTLLPHKWLAIGYAGGEQIFLKASRPVARGLRTGPDPEAPLCGVSGGALSVDEGLAWMIDYDRAVQVGMAVTIPLTGAAAQATDKVDVLLVVGLVEDLDPEAASTEFARLLDVHARTSGMAFVPQGTPTNNTEMVAAGWTPQETDLVALAERELKAPPHDQTRSPQDNASRFARALGLSQANFLGRLAHGTDREATRSQHMRVVLFEAVLGTLIRQLLDVGNENALSVQAMNAVRNWFINHVTGGAPVPTLRIGSQPYGILPVRRSVTTPNLTTTAGQVDRVIGLLIDVWRQSAALLPTLDSDQADTSGEGTLESAIATILATQPHPARFFIREFNEYVQGNLHSFFSLQTIYAAQIGIKDAATATGAYNQGISEAGHYYNDLLAQYYSGGCATIDDQIDLWNRVRDKLTNQHTGETLTKGLAFIDGILSILSTYELRQRPLRWLNLNRFEGVLGETNTTLVAGMLSGQSVEWGDVGLVQAPDAGPGSLAVDYLADLRQRFGTRGTSGLLDPAGVSLSPKPLLYQLLELTLPLIPNQPALNRQVLDALNGLAAIDPEQLEWLLRETLGLGAHRLDAWATSLASERLDRLRQARPTGIQIGAFGWITQLEPRRTQRPSEGFIHAPSMAQATTAALLRAGWHAHGSDDPLSAVAVNLSSERVRSAAWLLDGVRQGQPLGNLLGYRFERSLHDRFADDQIRPVRQLVLRAKGRPNASSDQPVDGIELLELFRNGQLGTIADPVRRALDDLEATFDAVQDIGLFEAVHQLTGGNYERATAMMDSISIGTIEPPELRSLLTPRSAVSVEHRVVILLRPDGPRPNRGWKEGIRDAIAPALEGWIASLLPPADDIGFRVTEISAEGQPDSRVSLTLAQLELSALDAVYLVGDDPLVVPAALRTLAAAALAMDGAVQVDPISTDTRVSLADFTVLAVELRRLVESLRPLDARDLRPAPTHGEADTNPSAALDAIETLILGIDRLSDDLDDAIDDAKLNDMAALVSRFARLGISNGASPRDIAAAIELQSQIKRRMDNVVAHSVDPANRQPGLETRLAALLGRRLPVLAQFTLAGSADGAVVDVTAGPATTIEVDDWLDAVSRVRADVGKLTTVGLLSELLGAGGLALSVGQAPMVAGEPWAATHRPLGAGRLSVVAVSGPGGPLAVGQIACGMLVDQWSESIPSDKQVTGVTFQYDAPSNRPAQAWLLAVPPDGEPWNLKLVIDTLLQTLEWAMLRAVGPEDLVDYGRAIPTIFAPGNIVGWPKETLS